jgi:hypothetical protein
MRSRKVMRHHVQALLALSVAGLAASAHGSWESMAHVAQPLLVRSGETAVWICRIPYVGHNLNPRDRGKALRLTTAPNHVLCDGRIENRNLAARAGIGFTVETVLDPHSNDMLTAMKDTLRVTVTLGEPDESLNPTIDAIVQATLWCGLLNARQAWPNVKCVEYVVDRADLRALGGVYTLDGLESSAAPRWGEDEKEMLFEHQRR